MTGSISEKHNWQQEYLGNMLGNEGKAKSTAVVLEDMTEKGLAEQNMEETENNRQGIQKKVRKQINGAMSW